MVDKLLVMKEYLEKKNLKKHVNLNTDFLGLITVQYLIQNKIKLYFIKIIKECTNLF